MPQLSSQSARTVWIEITLMTMVFDVSTSQSAWTVWIEIILSVIACSSKSVTVREDCVD